MTKTFDPDLVVLTDEPLNAETRLSAQRGLLTPIERFYVRSHFAIPDAPASLAVDGAVHERLELSRDELRAMPRARSIVTLECAGNGRAYFEPRARGEQWGLGAVSTAEWSGVPLAAVLERARPSRGAVEVLFRGADEGTPPDLGKRIAYERSLPLDVARAGAALLADEMNGEPLPREHGGPLRLVVPGWYGMASVKWLARITVLDTRFHGFYQTDRYVVRSRAVTRMAPRAVIVSPSDGEAVVRGHHYVRGYAWSGAAPLRAVEVSVDAGTSWDLAELLGDVEPHAWREWRFGWDAREHGATTLVARAFDAGGNAQPPSVRWNELGYGNNAIQRVRVRVG